MHMVLDRHIDCMRLLLMIVAAFLLGEGTYRSIVLILYCPLGSTLHTDHRNHGSIYCYWLPSSIFWPIAPAHQPIQADTDVRCNCRFFYLTDHSSRCRQYFGPCQEDQSKINSIKIKSYTYNNVYILQNAHCMILHLL